MNQASASEAEIQARWERRVRQFTTRRSRARLLSFVVVAVSVGVVSLAHLRNAGVKDWLIGTSVVALLFLNALQLYVLKLHSFLKCPRCEASPNDLGESILRTRVCSQCMARLR